MSVLTDILDYLSGANKTHEELNSFVNKRFNYFLNNSNLLLNFVSDFEDYKSGNLPNGKSKCNECEDLFILTNDIFEKYFNKISIPYNIETSEGESKTNYKDKVLYFFDLKDLKKILAAENLEKSSSDPTHFNKKRLLCKIISLSFIKIYIIVKSIFQTFNIYNSLVSNGDTREKQHYEEANPSYGFRHTEGAITPYQYKPYALARPDTLSKPDTLFDPSKDTKPDTLFDPSKDTKPDTLSDPSKDTKPDTLSDPTKDSKPDTLNEPTKDSTTDAPPNHEDDTKAEALTKSDDDDSKAEALTKSDEDTNADAPTKPDEDAKLKQQDGGGFLSNIYDKLVGNKKEISNPVNETISNEDIDVTSTSSLSSTSSSTSSSSSTSTLRDENTKLQTSNNIFYSIFVILFEDSKDEQLSADNFNAKFLTRGLDNMDKDNKTLSKKLPKIIEYLVNLSIFSEEFLGKSCLLFRDDNFKFMKLETSDTEDKEATLFIKEVDEELEDFDKIITTKRTLLSSILDKTHKEPLQKYSKSVTKQEIAEYKFYDAFKSHLKTMIKNYFKYRVDLYNNIVKELFVFDNKSKAIVSLNSKLTYKYISELSKKAEIILLDLHISVFNTLNTILTDCVNEISAMKTTETPPSEFQPEDRASPIRPDNTNTDANGDYDLNGGKIKNKIKKYTRRAIKRKNTNTRRKINTRRKSNTRRKISRKTNLKN